MALIAEGCLVPFSPGAKGNNGLMGKILQAVTSFGFRMCFTGLKEEVSLGVCVCACVPLSDCVLPGDMFRRNEQSDIRTSINLLIIHFALSPGMEGRLMVTWAMATYFPRAPRARGPCSFMLHHQLRAVQTGGVEGAWGRHLA